MSCMIFEKENCVATGNPSVRLVHSLCVLFANVPFIQSLFYVFRNILMILKIKCDEYIKVKHGCFMAEGKLAPILFP